VLAPAEFESEKHCSPRARTSLQSNIHSRRLVTRRGLLDSWCGFLLEFVTATGRETEEPSHWFVSERNDHPVLVELIVLGLGVTGLTAAPRSVRNTSRDLLAFAERTLTATLRQHLAERQVMPETWYALQLIASRGPKLARQALSHDLEGSRNLNADTTRELLARLQHEGLIRGETQVDLTAEGGSTSSIRRSDMTRSTMRWTSSVSCRRTCIRRSLPEQAG
jgi:hypothetical protein